MKPGVNFLGRPEGWSQDQGWRKLCRGIPEHERSISHKKAYLEWRALEVRIDNNSSVDCQISCEIVSNYKMEGNIEKNYRCCVISWRKRPSF